MRSEARAIINDREIRHINCRAAVSAKPQAAVAAVHQPLIGTF